MGSNINTSNKSDLKVEILGQNGTGTLAICGLAEHVEITSYRGGTENISKTLIFEEGKKIHEEEHKCDKNKHGLCIKYKPSKVMGKNTKIVWDPVHKGLLDLQYLNHNRIKIDSVHYDKNGDYTEEKYKILNFDDILLRNDPESITSSKILINIKDDNILEEFEDMSVKRFLDMDIAFAYVNKLNPYIDSFSNSNNTVDNGDHLDGALEAICRYFQLATKNMLSEKEKESLDIKWDDVKTGLSIVVSLRTDYERLYTGQTKHKVVNGDIRKIIINLTIEALTSYFSKNNSQLKELCMIVKMNAKVRREGDKVRTAVIKNTITNWSSYKMKNYDPCTRKGVKEYKEIFIIEGDSAKGSLKNARFPEFQALFSIRGVSLNVFKATIDQIFGPKGNKEFTDLVTILGCNVGPKFDLSKLQFSKIIIASDADVDGLFIRSLLMAFFFRVLPEIILDGRLYIAEPPLYRVDNPKDPFVINKEDYNNRYVKECMKYYQIGYPIIDNGVIVDVNILNKNDIKELLSDTSSYVKDIELLANHYRINERLFEIIIEEVALMNIDVNLCADIQKDIIDKINIQHLVTRIQAEFPEVYYDDKFKLIRGSINTVRQLIELSPNIIKKSKVIINYIIKWKTAQTKLVLRDNKTKAERLLSLLELLKVLRKYQPDIKHRFKGLGENDTDDIRKTIMDPNTRSLIKVNISDIENDEKIFQMLRGGTAQNALDRKNMMHNYSIPVELIDT